MKQVLCISLLLLLLTACKKEIKTFNSNNYLESVKTALKDSVAANDYGQLDFDKTVLNKVDSVQLFYLRIPFKGKSLMNDFVIVKTDYKGIIEEGKIVHLEGKENEYGDGKIKRRKFDGNISISSLNRKEILNSSIIDGYITAFHSNISTRETVYGTDVLPEVFVVAYVQSPDVFDYSTWLWLNSFFYINTYGDTGGGGSDYGSYYGSLGGGGGSGGNGNNGGGTGDTYSGITKDPTILVDVDTYIDKEPIDVERYLKCFDNIPDAGAQCEITIYADIPVDTDPNKLFDFSSGSPGHSFIQIKKTNGSQSVVQNIGFYPKTGWKTITNFPIAAKFVDDGQHEFNASYNKTLTPEELRTTIGQIRSLENSNYDLDDFNCTDFALSVFNSVGYTITIPRYLIPGSIKSDGVNTPQGIYNKLKEMKDANVPGSGNISIGFMKGWVTDSNGPCN
jgi:hypothetical protein